MEFLLISGIAGEEVHGGDAVWTDTNTIMPYRVKHACFSYNPITVINKRVGRVRTTRKRYHRAIYKVMNSNAPPVGFCTVSAKRGEKTLVLTQAGSW